MPESQSKDEGTGPVTGADLVLNAFSEAEARVLAKTRERITEVESRSIGASRKFFQDYHAKTEGVVRILAASRRKFEGGVEDFRAKLLAGPVTEEEFRARTVMLEMEYESRLKVAEEGYGILTRAFEEYSDREQERIRIACDDLQDAMRLRIEIARGDLIGPIRKRDEVMRKLAEELRETKESFNKAKAQLGELESATRSARRQGDEKLRETLREKDEALKEALERISAAQELGASGSPVNHALSEEKAARENVEKKLDQQRQIHSERIKQLQGIADRAWEKVRILESVRAELKEAVRIRKEAEAQAQRMSVRRDRADQERDEALADVTRNERAAFSAKEEILVLRAKVDAAQKESARCEPFEELLARSREENAHLLKRLDKRTPDPLASGSADAELELRLFESEAESRRLRDELEAMKARREEAEAQRAQALSSLEEKSKRIRDLQKAYLAADVGRDRKKDETAKERELEKLDLEERTSQAIREINTLRNTFTMSQRTWEESFARQDAMRMDEIFKLRAEIDRQKGAG